MRQEGRYSEDVAQSGQRTCAVGLDAVALFEAQCASEGLI